MSTHTDKNKESTLAVGRQQSQSAASVVAQSQRGSGLIFQLTDKRPAAMLQRKLQTMADNSPQALQFNALQQMANHSPQVKKAVQWQARANAPAVSPIQKQGIADEEELQMKSPTIQRMGEEEEELQMKAAIVQRKIIENKLNIVGEIHPHSDPIRKQEEAYAREQLKVPKKEEEKKIYWQEGDFAVSATDGKGYGDPKELRMLSFIFELVRQLENVEAKLEEISGDTDWGVDEKLKTLTKFGKALLFSMKGVKIEREIEQEIERFAGYCKDIQFDKLKGIYNYKNDLKGDVAAVRNHGTKITEKLKKDGDENKSPDDKFKDISYERSISMLEKARKYTDGGAVWKVGEAHARHIQAGGFAIGPLPSNISVTGTNEFDEAVKEYMEQNQDITEMDIDRWKKYASYLKGDESRMAYDAKLIQDGPQISWKARMAEKWGRAVEEDSDSFDGPDFDNPFAEGYEEKPTEKVPYDPYDPFASDPEDDSFASDTEVDSFG